MKTETKGFLETFFSISSEALAYAESSEIHNNERFYVKLCNTAFRQLLKKDLTGETLENHFHPEKALEQLCRRILQTSRASEEVHLLDCFQRKIKVVSMPYENGVLLSFKVIPDHNPVVLHPSFGDEIISAVPDFIQTENNFKVTFEKLKANELLLKEAERIGMMGSWEKNLDTGELKWSDGLYRIIGVKPHSIKVSSSCYIREFVHPKDRKKAQLHIRSIYENYSEEPAEYRIITGEGEKVLLSQPSIIRNQYKRAVMIRGIVRDITSQKIAEQNLVNLKLTQQKEILNAVLLAQEQERERIGEALHNGVAQQLYGILTRLEVLHADPQDAVYLKELKSITTETINDTRKISFELVPAVLRDYGIEVALRNLFQKVFTSNQLIQLCTTGIKIRLPEKIEFGIYRIVQELVNNIVRHSRATKADIAISLKHQHVTILVTDNGIGFTEKRLDPMSKGLGLQTIRNRVRLLEGSLKINSGTKGTYVRIRLPLK